MAGNCVQRQGGAITRVDRSPLGRAERHPTQAGSAVYTTGGSYVGLVETTFQRASPLVGQAGLDVAVVAIDPAVPDLPAPMSYKAMERAAATADPIEAHGHRTPGATSTVTAIVLQHLGPPPGGAWRDTFLTMHAVSVGGDSGAMVLHQQTHELVGHVVGGHSNAYSIVQDATAQLAALGATLR